MNLSYLISKISRILFPFIILFGFYIIFFGDVSPGGGFQGGAILATCYLVTYIVSNENTVNLHTFIKAEKTLFLLLLLVSSISLFSRFSPFTNPLPLDADLYYKRIFLISLNIIIALKVALGFVTIFHLFIQEGE